MTSRRTLIALFLLLAAIPALFFNSCRKDKGRLGNGYPEGIAKILVNKCSTPGCHSRQSKSACAGISLETWDDLFAGGDAGACCIPYSHAYSTIFLFTNTDPAAGPVNAPTMPYNQQPLSKEEVKMLSDWIDAGAPSAEGKIMWADNPARKKFYVTNQGCDVVTVFDASTLLQMRYINVGASGQIESPHMLKISPDGQYWYTCFSASGMVFQKFRTSDDSYVSQASLPAGSWNTFAVTPDSKKAFAVNWNSNGIVAYIDLPAMTTKLQYQGSGLFVWPHGSAITKDGNTLYVTAQQGNAMYKVDITDPMNPGINNPFSLDPPNPPNTANGMHPHDVAFSPDSLYYFVTCETTNEVRVFQTSNDSYVTSLPTGHDPVELSFSKSTPYLFVTCMYDSTTAQYPFRGSVTVIDYKNLSVVKNIKDINIAEPHGIGVDDARGLVYVASRNLDGPLPHHSTSCSGRVGFVSFIDLKTLSVLSKKIEVAVDPYSIAVRN